MFITHLKSKAKIILPRNFIHPDISEKYEKFLGSTEIDGQPFLNASNYVNSTIQALNAGNSLQFETINQTKYSGKKNHYKGNKKDKFELWPRDISITFASKNGYLNYVMILEAMMRHQTSGDKDDLYLDDIIVIHYDMNDRPIVKFNYKNGLFTSLSNVRFDFREIDSDGDNFDLGIAISGVEVERLI